MRFSIPRSQEKKLLAWLQSKASNPRNLQKFWEIICKAFQYACNGRKLYIRVQGLGSNEIEQIPIGGEP